MMSRWGVSSVRSPASHPTVLRSVEINTFGLRLEQKEQKMLHLHLGLSVHLQRIPVTGAVCRVLRDQNAWSNSGGSQSSTTVYLSRLVAQLLLRSGCFQHALVHTMDTLVQTHGNRGGTQISPESSYDLPTLGPGKGECRQIQNSHRMPCLLEAEGR